MSKYPLVGRVYRHYKGDYYVVRGVVKHSETLEEMVLYQALYGEGEMWVRPLESFMGEVGDKVGDGVDADVDVRQRFELQEIKSCREKK